MFCEKCGQKLSADAKFCSNCGKSTSANRQQREEWTEISRSFKLPLMQVFTTPDRLVREVNQWFSEHPGIRRAYLNLHIAEGQTRGLTLTCKEAKTPSTQRFHIDCVVMMPKNLFGAFGALVRRPSSDKHMNEWRRNHPDAQVITQRVVTNQSIPSELWIVYREETS